MEQNQLTFSEKMIESDMEKFKETGDVKFYVSARSMAESERAPYLFASMKKELMLKPELALKISLHDGSYWEALKLVIQKPFSLDITLNTLKHIHVHTDDEEFDMLINVARENLLAYVLIGDSTSKIDISKSKERNLLIKVALSYLELQNKKNTMDIEEWESSLEKDFMNDPELANAYHKYWGVIRDF